MLLADQFTEIEHLFEHITIKNERVSKAPISWHVDHSLKVITTVAITIRKSDPTTYKKSFNAMRSFFFLLQWFPRGKGKAPKAVRTYEDISLDTLKMELEVAKNEVARLNNLDVNSNFRHPLFGVLNLKQSKKFLKMHTEHHLKICRDILK